MSGQERGKPAVCAACGRDILVGMTSGLLDKRGIAVLRESDHKPFYCCARRPACRVRATELAAEPDAPEWAIGDEVVKPKGYPFDGTIRAVFTNAAGQTRVVVEFQHDSGMLHIFSPTQIARPGPVAYTAKEPRE